jgi:carboxy-terminal domain RNA polymerase II polypeptide A small phosphatase
MDKLLLILDLDETLIHATKKQLSDAPDFIVFDYFIYKRPHLDAFLQQCQEDYTLAIWSSASDDYVKEIVKKIIPNTIELAFVHGRTHCTPRRLTEEDYARDAYDNSPYHYTKQLKKLKRKGYDLNKMLIIDDTPEKVKDNYGNAIYSKEFLGDKGDNELILLTKYLKTLVNCPNLRKTEKRNWRKSV